MTLQHDTDTEECADDAESTYEMYFDDISDANTEGRARLLNLRAQIMVLLFIDGSSYIRTNERGWRGFFLFRHHRPTNRFALLGFCTAYEFWHVPDRIRLRISQILIFPPYQRQGHGSLSFFLFPNHLHTHTHTCHPLSHLAVRFVDAIYRFAREDARVYDVTVEDPDDDFQFVPLLSHPLCMRPSPFNNNNNKNRIVRDLCELRCLRKQGYFGTFETSLPRETYTRIHTELKRCQPQIYRCWLVCMWLCATADGREETLRQYRLVLKAFLAARFSDWLQDCATPDDRKRVLQDIYNEHIADWELLGAALHRLEAKDDTLGAAVAAKST